MISWGFGAEETVLQCIHYEERMWGEKEAANDKLNQQNKQFSIREQLQNIFDI